ncbi:MAG: M20/M25/M40 family metallo-hydrolase [Thermodesulfovibrionales bacterium]
MFAHHINRKRLVDTFVELVSINSPSFQEQEIGELLAKKLEDAGCRVEKQEYDRSFNLLAFRKGARQEAPPLLLNAHMDTIEPTTGISLVMENDLIRTTGTTVLGADDKSALAQIVEAVTVLHERGIPHGDIEIALTSAEEKGLFGAKNLDHGRFRSRHALVLDSSGSVGRLIVAAPTHLTYEMQITGRSAHAGIEPEKGINAIRVAARIIAGVPDGKLDEGTTANIGSIRGGTATNVVPKEVVLSGELRSHTVETLEKTKQSIYETAHRIAAECQARLRIEENMEYRAFRIQEDTLFLRFLQGVFRKCGIEPVLAATGGGSDANIFNQRGITAINLSNGMQKVHSTEEYISLKDLYNGCLVLLTAVANFGNAAI